MTLTIKLIKIFYILIIAIKIITLNIIIKYRMKRKRNIKNKKQGDNKT